MRVTMMQPYLFPYIGYFQLIHSVDRFIFYDDVAFIMRGWINRNHILLNHGKHLFTVPLSKASPNKLIKDVDIHPEDTWKTNLLRTITAAYEKAPYFAAVFPLIESVFTQGHQQISELAKASVQMVLDYAGLERSIEASSMIYSNQALKREFRVMDIALKEKAETCIVPIGGRELYDRDFFLTHGLKLYYLKPNTARYRQWHNSGFIANLSIVDVMMFNGKARILELMGCYELV